MDFTETPLRGAFLVRARKIEDHRGFFARAWCGEEFAQHGLNPNVRQINAASSHTKGTLRGLHYQEEPHAEAKFVWCTRGAIYDVIVDLRRNSTTCGQWFATELTADGGTMLYAPEGFGHGYQTLTPDADVYYLTTAPYAPHAASGVRYDDRVLNIEWPLDVTEISDTDRQWPDYRG
jgi:dTDP-4-dehydrorhamnose 3,5-epimerase